MGDDVQNIGGVSVMVTAVYLLLLAGVFMFDKKHPLPACNEYAHSGRSILSLRYETWGNRIHRISRALMFLYWLGLGWITKWLRDAPHPTFYMFTVWNIIMFVVYFLAANIASWQYAIDPNNEDASFPSWWGKGRRNWVAHLVRVLHSVMGGSALFVTLSAWQGHGSFWAIQQHLTNSLLFLLEGLQTPYVPRILHFRWTCSFLYVYCCFVWIIVHAMGQYNWPYPFMQTYTDPALAYLSYFAVLVSNGAAFLLFKYYKFFVVKFFVWVRGTATDVLDVPEEAATDRDTPPDSNELHMHLDQF